MPMARFHTRSPIIVFLTVLFIVQVWKVSTHAVEDNVKFVELQTDVGDNSYGGVKAHIVQTVIRNAIGDAPRHHCIIGVSSTAEYAVRNVTAFHLVHMATEMFALAMPI
ncbi:uncharacterized protein LOC131055928 isoform X2 [Cryptomeria japonica]|uniref:uncharacterized protein LOC131055928 isoform X2 n=1 Tax=Cryptomeria japonica TaxID=3369 RepID=UPI0025AC13F9|nr:uncharacterized protein LOC131055928 isoform X2 [Cryptomeria japonica]